MKHLRIALLAALLVITASVMFGCEPNQPIITAPAPPAADAPQPGACPQ